MINVEYEAILTRHISLLLAQVWTNNSTAEVWIKPLADGRAAALVFNRGDSEARDIEVSGMGRQPRQPAPPLLLM